MTRAQQDAKKKLEAAEADWLIACGWSPVGRAWMHPRIKTETRYTTHDALEQLRADPTLRWP